MDQNTPTKGMLLQIVNCLAQGQTTSEKSLFPYSVSHRTEGENRNQPRNSKLKNNRPRAKKTIKHKDMPHFQRRH
jgi:hypothetical protein